MRLIAFQAENVKRIKAVDINVDGSLCVIGGANEQGKSSTLDAIEYALNGAKSVPEQVIRKGETKARIVLDLDEIIVTRIFTLGEDGEERTRLVVKSKDGAIFSSPQAMLKSLVGDIAFDPLEFAEMKCEDQVQVLRNLIGIDLDQFDNTYAEVYQKRTDINRQGKEAKALLDSLTHYEDIKETKEVSIRDLTEQHSKAIKHNQQIELENRSIQAAQDEISLLKQRIADLEANISARQDRIKEMGPEIDTTEIEDRISCLEETNEKIRANNAWADANHKVESLRKLSRTYSEQLETIKLEKKAALDSAKMPVKGLSIDNGAVTFKGINLTECSTAQKIKISVAIGFAMNPKLKLLLIREGSFLDEKNLEIVAKMAARVDGQILMERVSKGDECQIIIEDGMVLEREAA